MIATLVLLGAALGLTRGLTSPRRYVSDATFIPQGTDGGVSAGLSLAASQLGVRVPSSSNSWGPPIYVELLRSRALLEPIAFDTVSVLEEGGRRAAIIDLLDVNVSSSAKRADDAVRALENIVKANEDRKLGAVRLTVTTKWPSVSLAVAQRLVRGVNMFNLETRKSQAAAERQFAEIQAGEAEAALRAAEDRLQSFLQGNRSISGSQELAFQMDRLRRDVTLRQQVYTALVQNREEARLREVRDTPVITVLEEPRLPVVSESRGTAKKMVLGVLVGGFLGMVIAFVVEAMAAARHAQNAEAREFFQLIEELTPRFFKRRHGGDQHLVQNR
jgi:tyrosine-protein kinase Etk/Wzc